MEKNQNTITKIGKSIKNMFVRLFGLGKHKEELDKELIIDTNSNNNNENKNLKEEEIVSPTRQIFRKFIRNRIAIVGLVMFTVVLAFVIIGNSTIDFSASYLEPSQQYIEPGFGYTRVPRGLQKEGVKVVVDEDGNENYLIDGGTAFTIAISNANKLYIWGANIDGIKKVPANIKEKVADIVQLSVGSRHAVALTSKGEFLAWGSNGFEQAQIPVFNPGTDSAAQYKKSIQAYFDPSVRNEFKAQLVTTIEEEPIKKVYAGDQFTLIQTVDDTVFAWGVIRTLDLDQADKTFNALDVKFRYSVTEGLRWKFGSEDNTFYNRDNRLVFTHDQLIDKFELPADAEIRYSATGRLQYRTEGASWENVEGGEYEDLVNELDSNVVNRNIVNIHVLYEHVIYELDDNRFIPVGVPGQIKEGYPSDLYKTADERGFRVEKIVGTLKNAFYLTDDGKIYGWGASSSENILNKVSEEFKNYKITDVEAGSYHLTLLDETGKTHVYGYNNILGHLNMPNNLKESKKVVANYFNNYSIEKDGTIKAWGNKGYLFGTDKVGADVYKRIVAGGSMTLSVAVIAVVVSLVIGLTVGLIAGFYGKWLDNVLMRFGEIISAFPFLPLAMTLASIVLQMGLGERERIFMIMFILGLLSWPGLARLVRGQILAEREKDYILAAKALGIKERHIILRHILPNVVNVVIVNTTLSYAGALLTESGLSFLGFGVMYPQPSWGNMLTGAQSMTVLRNYWWLWIIPAMFIIATALSINLVGDGLREAMDPKSNER